MIKVAITGNLGSGKTTICQVFEEDFGIPVYYTDYQAKRVMQSDPKVIKKIKKEFGENIYKNGNLDKKSLANIVFSSKRKLKRLNKIVHPVVEENFNYWAENQDSPYVIAESAITIESGNKDKYDYIIVVSADKEKRIKRSMKRDSCSREDIEKRIESQMSDEEKNKHADAVIYNNTPIDMDGKFKRIHNEIMKTMKKETRAEKIQRIIKKHRIIKTFTWRTAAWIITICVSGAVIGDIKVALSIGSIDIVIKLAGYYFHEKAWDKYSEKKIKEVKEKYPK